MKDKLRELAEMVRDAYRAGFIAACKWPSPVSQDVDSSAYNKEFNAWSFSVREKHAAILDAEGDGGAVAWFTDDHLSDKSATTYSKEVADRWSAKGWPVNPLYPHPARSGVVRDEDVIHAWGVFCHSKEIADATTGDKNTLAHMRAALESFARITP